MSTRQSSFVLGSIFYFIFSALSLPYCIYCLYRFISISTNNSKDGYFKRRHPVPNIIFLLCFFVATFIIYPLLVILGIIGYETLPMLNAIGIMDQLTSVMLFAIFMCRVWFLYSEYALHYNMSSWIWKREINPLESNCIIKYRQFFGNAKCCTLVLFLTLFVPIIIIFDIIPLFLVNYVTEMLLQIAIVLLFTAFTLYMLLSQLKRVLDVYHIRKELVYEIAVFGSLLLFNQIASCVLLITNTLNRTQQILFSSILSTITGILVIYIGTNWVLIKFKHYKLFQSMADLPTETKDQRVDSQDLIEILNTEQGFESFLLHLVHELQLEKMLFIIEILQFKQEIKNRLKEIALGLNPTSEEQLKLDYILDNKHNEFSDETITLLFEIDLKALGIPQDPRLKQWSINQFAVHLYDKYIEEGASLQLSISSECQRFIYSYFRARAMSQDTDTFPNPVQMESGTERKDATISTKDDDDDEASEDDKDNDTVLVYTKVKPDDDDEEDEDDNDDTNKVQHKYHKEMQYNALVHTQITQEIQQDPMEQMVGIEVFGNKNIKIIYDLFRLYDSALRHVWSAISNEIFNRFKKTTEYQAIYDTIFNNVTHEKHVLQRSAISSNSITMQ